MATIDSTERLDSYLIPGSFSTPYIVKGSGAEVEDDTGRRYLDFEAGPGVVSTGHCHPKVVAAVQEQAATLTQSPGRYHSPLSMRLAKRISELTGKRLRRAFFTNSGAESNDGAIKLALKHAVRSGKKGFGIIALEHGFHGRLALPLALTGMSDRKKGFGPYGTFPGVVHAPAPYCYRCPFGLQPGSCGLRCATAIEEMMKTRVPGEAAVMIAEPILGVGGILIPPDGYWEKVQEICKRYDVTLIHDEVFTGFGRTGRMFAHQHWDVKPDVVTFAKAIGGGVPLGGFIASEEVGTAFESGDHFTTFGGNNQIGAAAGLAVLDVLEEERLPEHAAAMGELLLKALGDLQSRFSCIGDVRGKGLLIGIELVQDRESKAPAADLTKKVKKAMEDRGVLVSTTGVHGCVVRLTPPLIIQREHVERAVAALEDSLKQLSASGSGA